ncbi:hypothetical protein PFISCL1PPCAC_14092, partial [Pristionchus fissidentatus]
QNATTSRAMRMKQLYISALIRQTAMISLFYVYPLLLTMVVFRFQIDFAPNFLLISWRIGAVITYMFHSVPQFHILISANQFFQKV